MKRVSIAVTNDLVTDQRVDKVCNTLTKMGFAVTLTGRILRSSLAMDQRRYSCQRMRLLFTKGPFFYAEFNIRLFFRLLVETNHLIVSNDLDTLPASWLVSRIKRIPLVYDSHEFYTETPELVSRPVIRSVWLQIERMIFPRLRWVFTVNDSIADAYRDRYDVDIRVVKNMPRFRPPALSQPVEELGLPSNLPIVLLQGAGINIDRGAEELVEAMRFVDSAQLLIAGHGDVMDTLHRIRREMKLEHRVTIVGRQPYEALRRITASATIGITIDKDTNPNYRFSLPNKLFDYIQAGTPVLASRLPEIEKIVSGYDVGEFIDSHEPAHIAEKIISMIQNPGNLSQWKANCLKASRDLCWESQEPELQAVYAQFL